MKTESELVSALQIERFAEHFPVIDSKTSSEYEVGINGKSYTITSLVAAVREASDEVVKDVIAMQDTFLVRSKNGFTANMSLRDILLLSRVSDIQLRIHELIGDKMNVNFSDSNE
jgi:hypothetical protein